MTHNDFAKLNRFIEHRARLAKKNLEAYHEHTTRDLEEGNVNSLTYSDIYANSLVWVGIQKWLERRNEEHMNTPIDEANMSLDEMLRRFKEWCLVKLESTADNELIPASSRVQMIKEYLSMYNFIEVLEKQ